MVIYGSGQSWEKNIFRWKSWEPLCGKHLGWIPQLMFIDARMRAKFRMQSFQLLLFIARINLESIREINFGIVSVEMRMIIIQVSVNARF